MLLAVVVRVASAWVMMFWTSVVREEVASVMVEVAPERVDVVEEVAPETASIVEDVTSVMAPVMSLRPKLCATMAKKRNRMIFKGVIIASLFFIF